jgi:hypothetical protein
LRNGIITFLQTVKFAAALDVEQLAAMASQPGMCYPAEVVRLQIELLSRRVI